MGSKAPKERKPTKAEQEYARAMAVRQMGMEFHLSSLLRHFTLDEVIERWWRAQVSA